MPLSSIESPIPRQSIVTVPAPNFTKVYSVPRVKVDPVGIKND